MTKWTEDDVRFMRRAIVLARRGYPAPNPHVGCVLVREGRVVGEGYHHHAGGPHAEAVALAHAGDLARNATAYVTLEPCNHHGRTPPCSDALVQAGISRVVFSVSDPNPTAVGGEERLQQSGILVESGLLIDEASLACEQFLTSLQLQRPLVVVKAAVTLDARSALPNGESKWITGPAARRASHRLRADLGAVLVGRKTVERDDPLLTARIPGVTNQPLRIVLDPHARLTGKERVFGPEAETLHVTGEIKLPELLAMLFERRVTGLLVEGGYLTISQFVRADLVNRFEIFMAPKLFGRGLGWVGLPTTHLEQAKELEFERIRKVGSDIWVTARPKNS